MTDIRADDSACGCLLYLEPSARLWLCALHRDDPKGSAWRAVDTIDDRTAHREGLL